MVKKLGVKFGIWVFGLVLRWVDKDDKAEELASKLVESFEKKVGGLTKDVQDSIAGIMIDVIRGVYGANVAGYKAFVRSLKEEI